MPEKSGFSDLYLTEVSPRDKPWDVHRAESQEVGQLYRDGEYNRYADRIEECSQWLGFNITSPNELGESKLKLDQTHFCRVRHCPVCQWRRSLMWYARFLKQLPDVIQANPKARWVFLTLTVKNCPLEELRATVKHMNASWKRLSERKQFPGIGWVKSLEVTRGEDDSVHPHFHVLMMVRSSYFTHGYIKHSRWIELWKECLRVSYDPSVHIRRVNYDEQALELSNDRDENPKLTSLPVEGIAYAVAPGIMLAVLETMKYAVKPADLLRSLDPQWLCELTKQLHKTRAIAIGGLLKPYFSENETEAEMIQGNDEGEIIDKSGFIAWFGWREMTKRYIKIDESEVKAVAAKNNIPL